MATKKRTAPSPIVVLEEWKAEGCSIRVCYDAKTDALVPMYRDDYRKSRKWEKGPIFEFEWEAMP